MFCPHCGKELPLEANFCTACGRGPAATPASARIVRPRSPRIIAGVCSGFALHFGWDVTVTRVLFALLCCFTFCVGVLFYIAAWIMLPDAQYALPPNIQQQRP
jgi:phage shock protein C